MGRGTLSYSPPSSSAQLSPPSRPAPLCTCQTDISEAFCRWPAQWMGPCQHPPSLSLGKKCRARHLSGWKKSAVASAVPPSLPPALARAEAERASGGWRQRRCQRPPHRLAMHLGLFCWLATSAYLGPSSSPSSIHPALFVYNLNVVFVCCRSLLPAKKSLSLSLSLSHPQQNESSSSVAADAAAAFSDETSDFSTERSKSFYGWPLVLFGGKMRRAHLQFRRKQPNQGRIVFFRQMCVVSRLTAMMTI